MKDKKIDPELIRAYMLDGPPPIKDADLDFHTGQARQIDLHLDKIDQNQSSKATALEIQLKQLDRSLDDALFDDVRRVEIVHGKGSGTLRDEVLKYLKKHPLVAELNDQSSPGSIKITLK